MTLGVAAESIPAVVLISRLAGHYQKAPLQVMPALYFDPLRADMPYTMSAGGGIVQGDRLRTDIAFDPGTSAHLTTQAHTSLYSLDSNYASATTFLSLGENSLAPTGAGLLFGVSILPQESGMWLRIMGDDPTLIAKANTVAWVVAHQRLANAAAPLIRKS